MTDNEQEISLRDIAITLWHKRIPLISIWVLLTILGVAVAFLKPPAYRFDQVIQIGSVPKENGDVMALEDAETVNAKLQNAVVPTVSVKWKDKLGYRAEIEVNVPKGTSIITLSTDGLLDHATKLKEMLSEVATNLIDDHRDLLESHRLSLVSARTSILGQREETDARLSQVESKVANINQTISFLESEEKSLSITATNLEEELKGIRSSGGETEKQLSILLLNDKIQQVEERRTNILERIHRTLPDERKQLEVQKVQLSGKLNDLEAEMAMVDAKIEGLQATRTVAQPIRSERPVGLYGWRFAVLLSVFGFMLGIVSAFFLAFVESVRQDL